MVLSRHQKAESPFTDSLENVVTFIYLRITVFRKKLRGHGILAMLAAILFKKSFVFPLLAILNGCGTTWKTYP
jgi:hypothetical protein